MSQLVVKYQAPPEKFKEWPMDRMLADDCEAADYSHFDQNDSPTVFDIEDGIQYHTGLNQVVRYRRISSHTIVREFVEYEVQ